MLKKINSNDKGSGIYEIFGTPVYSHKRELDQLENSFYGDVLLHLGDALPAPADVPALRGEKAAK